MDYNAATQLRLKPSGLGRHNVAAVGDVDKLLHRNRIECKSNLHLATVNPLLQLAQAADTTHEVDAFVPAEVFDAEYLVKYEVRKNGYIQNPNGVAVVVGALFGGHRVPLAIEIEAEVVKSIGLVDLCALRLHNNVFLYGCEELLFREAIQVLHYAVVVDDVELCIGKITARK